MSVAAVPVSRASDLRRALLLTYVTLGWMTIEGVASLWLGARSHSLLLDGFGLDSLVELASAGVLLWRLRVEASGQADEARIEYAERRAARFCGLCLYGLAAFVVASSVYGLWTHRVTDTHESAWGILIGLTAKVGMPLLAGVEAESRRASGVSRPARGRDGGHHVRLSLGGADDRAGGDAPAGMVGAGQPPCAGLSAVPAERRARSDDGRMLLWD